MTNNNHPTTSFSSQQQQQQQQHHSNHSHHHRSNQNHSRDRHNQVILPGPNSLLAGALPQSYPPPNLLPSASSTPSDSFQDQFTRSSALHRHQFRITARQFSNEIRDIQHITAQVIRDSAQVSNNIHTNHNNNTNHNNIHHNDDNINSQLQSLPDSLFFPTQPFEGLRRFREQMDRVYNQATSISFAAPTEPSSSTGTSLPSQFSNSLLEETAPGLHRSPIHTAPPPIRDLQPSLFDLPDQPPATPFPTNSAPTNEPSSSNPVHQDRTHEFADHSARARLNRRPRLSPVPSYSSDHDITESLESFRRCGERLKRSYNSAKLDSTNFTSDQDTDAEPREPTTAELAEAAARASNEQNALPAFYSPDESLKIIKVVIPVDTNPMERRKIIFEASKDGSIRWKDSNQKAVYERSNDGLVGEEIGEIEFHYIFLPKKKKQLSNSLPSLGTGPNRSVQPSSLSLPRSSNRYNADRAAGEALDRINEARTQENRSMRDHQYTYHPNRYQLYQRPHYRLVAASRRHMPINRDLTFDLPNPHRNSSTAHRELNRSASRPTAYESFSSSGNNHNNSSSRLTRRPISWSGRFYSAHSDHFRSTSSNHPPLQDQEHNRHDDNHIEQSEQEESSIYDDSDWSHPPHPGLQSPPFYEMDPPNALVHF